MRRGAPKGTPKHGGRKVGVLNKVTPDMRALARDYSPKAFENLVWLSEHADTHAVQLSAIKELLDRAYGKALQALDGNGLGGPVNVTVRWLEDDEEPGILPDLGARRNGMLV
jgi:hypothetical protein